MKIQLDVVIVVEVDDEDGEDLLETSTLNPEEISAKVRIHGLADCQIHHEGVVRTNLLRHDVINIQENELV